MNGRSLGEESHVMTTCLPSDRSVSSAIRNVSSSPSRLARSWTSSMSSMSSSWYRRRNSALLAGRLSRNWSLYECVVTYRDRTQRLRLSVRSRIERRRCVLPTPGTPQMTRGLCTSAGFSATARAASCAKRFLSLMTKVSKVLSLLSIWRPIGSAECGRTA